MYEPLPPALRGRIDVLMANGRLLIETSERQAPQTAAMVAAGGLNARVIGSEEFSPTGAPERTGLAVPFGTRQGRETHVADSSH